MQQDVNFKNILIGTIISIIVIVCVELFRPYEIIDLSFIEDIFNDIKQSQTISPERLYINVWRIAKNEYVDKTMNGQDWQRWRNRYNGKIKTKADAKVAINTMLASLNDNYTKFLSSGSFAKQKIILDSKITGVGVIYNKIGDEVVIDNVLKNSSAFSQNVLPGDKIVSIDGVSTKELETSQIQNLIENSGSTAVMEVQRGDEVLVKELERAEIPLDTMRYKITDDNIGIINLTTIMGEDALKDFEEIILSTNKTKGLIIDLRNNYGGILSNAIQMSDMMMKNTKIIDLETREKQKFEIYSDENSDFIEKPIVILVNKKTASAAEILTGALKHGLGAVVIGQNTFGKNSVQHVIPLSNNTGLFITTDKYILPNNEDISNVGITPDLYLNKPADYKGSDYGLNEAIQIINKETKNTFN